MGWVLNSMGRKFNIPWVGGQYTKGRGVKIPWVGVQNTWDIGPIFRGWGLNIPWVMDSIYHDTLWIGGSKYHG